MADGAHWDSKGGASDTDRIGNEFVARGVGHVRGRQVKREKEFRSGFLLIMRQGRRSEATETFFCLQAKKLIHTWARTGCQYIICLSVCLCVSVCVCVTFVVFTDCESCTRPLSTNPGSMEACEYGLTRGTSFVARRLEVVAVAGLL